MIKRLLFSIILAVPLLFNFNSNTFATEEVDKKEYKEMMKAVKEKVKQGKEDEIEQLPEVISFNEKYSPEQISEFVKNTEAMNKKNFNKNVDKNGKKLIEFEDGSFVVVKNTTTEIPEPNSLKQNITNNFKNFPKITPPNLKGQITPSATGTAGKSYQNDWELQFWGIYKACELHLITDFKLYTTKIDITDTDHAGTMANFPTTVDSITTSVVTDNAKKVQSKGNYRKVNGIVIGGQSIGTVTYHTLRTTIAITGVSGTKVTYKVTDTED